MAMIRGGAAKTPGAIADFIKANLDALDLPDFSKYNKYYLIVPPEFSGIIRMLNVKFIELLPQRSARHRNQRIRASRYHRSAAMSYL